MDGATLKNLLEECIGGEELDDTIAYQLLDNAKDKREADMELEVLKKLDSSNTAVIGRTYSTGYDLATDFYIPSKVMVGTTEQRPIMFEEQIHYKDVGGYYFIDHAESKLHLTGTVSKADTINIFYIYATDSVETTDPVWSSKFHPLIAFDAAKLYLGGIDYDDENSKMAPAFRREAKILDDLMRSWNTKLQLTSMDNSTKRWHQRVDAQGFASDNVIL